MRSYDELYIGGRWVDPATDARIAVICPFTEELIGSAPAAATADVDLAVARARAAFDDGWPARPVRERAELLERIVKLYEEHAAEMAELVIAEMGAPYAMAHLPVPAIVRTLIAIAERHPWEERRPGAWGGEVIVRREAAGVVAAVVPWNAPQPLIFAKLAPALLAGCTVVVKPSPETPLDALYLAELIDRAGAPEGVVSIIPAEREVSEYLVAHPGVDVVSFTGSAATGRRVASVCGEGVKRVHLELGGKSAAVILDDADLDATVEGLKGSAFANSGQACALQTRVLAPRSRFDEVGEALSDLVSSLVVGDPRDPAIEIGPMVSRRQQERVLGYIKTGIDEGARLVAGGLGMPDGIERGWYVRPTLFSEVDNGMRIAREEIFGPVLCLIPYDDVDDAVRIANDSEYGLGGAVWTGDLERGLDVARRIRTGTCGVNRYAIDPVAPFGGVKASGIGRQHGPEGLDEYVETKAIVLPVP